MNSLPRIDPPQRATYLYRREHLLSLRAKYREEPLVGLTVVNGSVFKVTTVDRLLTVCIEATERELATLEAPK